MSTTAIVTALTALFLPAAEERSESRFIIVQPGYPGSTSEAEMFVSDFANAIEKAGGPKGLEGAYYNDEKEALEAIESEKPFFGVVSLGFFLAHRKDLNLEPLLASRPLERFYLAAKKGVVPKSLADLAGKTVEGTAFAEKPFVEWILFGPGAEVSQGSGPGFSSPDGKGVAGGTSTGNPACDLSKWNIKATDGFSKAVRDVARGRAAAVLLTERERRAMEETAAGKELEVFYRTEPLPTAIVVSFGKPDVAAQAAAKGLSNLKEAPGGETIITTMGIEGFAPVDPRLMERLTARYEKAVGSGTKSGSSGSGTKSGSGTDSGSRTKSGE